MPLLPTDNFLANLEQEAKRQSQLHRHQLLPQQLGGVGRWVALHPWQFLMIISGVTAVVVELIQMGAGK